MTRHGGPETRDATLAIALPARLLTAMEREAARRQMTLAGCVGMILDDFLRELAARTHGLQHPVAPPCPGALAALIVADPEGRIRDPFPGRTLGEPHARGRATA